MNNESLVSKVWSFCNVLKDDDVSYGDLVPHQSFSKWWEEGPHPMGGVHL